LFQTAATRAAFLLRQTKTKIILCHSDKERSDKEESAVANSFGEAGANY
jgi:hypothetical protein